MREPQSRLFFFFFFFCYLICRLFIHHAYRSIIMYINYLFVPDCLLSRVFLHSLYKPLFMYPIIRLTCSICFHTESFFIRLVFSQGSCKFFLESQFNIHQFHITPLFQKSFEFLVTSATDVQLSLLLIIVHYIQ